MKKTILLLLATSSIFSQTLQNPTFGKLKVGNGLFSVDDSAILINRSLTTGGTSLGFHALRDETLYNTNATSGLRAYASYDGIPKMQGTAIFNHLHVFQSRPNFSGTATIDALRGFTHQSTIASGTVDLHQAIFIDDFLGTGTANQNVGVYIKALTKGSSNFSIFTEGTTPSFFGGAVQSNGIMKASSFTATSLTGTFGQILSLDSTGNFLGNPNLTIINGTLLMKNATISKLKSSTTNLDIESNLGVRFFTSTSSFSEKARISLNGNLLLGTTNDNNIDKIQVNGTISASPATLSNQVVVKSQLDANFVSKGVENLTTTPLTIAILNSTYPNATIGFKVYCPNLGSNSIYEKTPSSWVNY